MGLCTWIVFGFFAGLIARAVMPGRQGMGLISTTLLGVAGSFMGGFLASVLRGGNWHVLQPSGFIGAIVGAIALLAIGRMMSDRR
ncbi:GlsB/YeaQ/YmgE family stress response membrane protein [Vitiosangium sp. GDMCC 1.1324]|uniref:GlsB/YeaQ/YmgE family stress response membrane protein n=1 Tax=Vitiosangium sp. (strain GDMCC 1.1324) TaxID=2138576 RepID=UPI000D3481EF|nr:GlsB/YeaQ/YmgE family stress response membrane protein [Vitiosangium sp. GDMCC 1.1324]PTL85118.1 GlsB/YeaQ/YmgE family stress response membrane protein [Vitiosangium sp. GDMCC 1.1324]